MRAFFRSRLPRGARIAIVAAAAASLVTGVIFLALPEERGGARRVHAAPVVVPAHPIAAAPTVPDPSTPSPALHATLATVRAVADRSGVIRQVVADDGGGPVVALTFDDGPDPAWTPQVLALLREAGIHATFCLVGTWAQRYPGLVRAIVADGNTICDHTEHHVEHLDRHRRADASAEIGDGEQAIVAAGVPAPRYYRPPGGSLSPMIVDVAHRDGLAVLGWSIDPRDWRAPPADQIAGYVEAGVRPGSIVLLHDGGGDRSQTVAAARALVGALSARGYRFAALP